MPLVVSEGLGTATSSKLCRAIERGEILRDQDRQLGVLERDGLGRSIPEAAGDLAHHSIGWPSSSRALSTWTSRVRERNSTTTVSNSSPSVQEAS